MDRTIGITTKFSITLSEQIDEAVKEYGFKNTSEFIRSSVTYFFDFIELKEKLKDPEVNRKFIEEHDPLIQAEKDIIRLDQVTGYMTQEEIIRHQFALDKESNKRITIANRSLKMNKEVMQRGGEINQKIGYHDCFHDDGSVFYVPIEPRFPKWKELSMLQKETLRDELKIKSEAYHQRYDSRISFEHTIKDITEAIEREKK
jgi:Arc/MetJ-type ribon-helix-helix transcriptional regulator